MSNRYIRISIGDLVSEPLSNSIYIIDSIVPNKKLCRMLEINGRGGHNYTIKERDVVVYNENTSGLSLDIWVDHNVVAFKVIKRSRLIEKLYIR